MNGKSRSLVALLGVLVMVGSCVDGNAPLGPEGTPRVQIPIQASVLPSASNAQAGAVNRIRAVAERVPDGFVLGSTTQDVSETAEEWEISLDLPVTGSGVSFVVFLELIHVDGAGNETVEFSGRTAPQLLVAGPIGGEGSTPIEVTVVRGPPANLFVTGIDVTPGSITIFEGESATLEAAVTLAGSGGAPTVFWTSLDEGVATVAGGTVSAVAPGVARVVASAGPAADTAEVTVVAPPEAVVVDPDTIQVVGAGEEGVFTGQVIDTRGGVFEAGALLWRSLDPSVVESLGDGRFVSIAPGTGRMEARAVVDTTLKDEGVVIVRTPTVDLAITKTASTAAAHVGDTVIFTITVTSLAAEGVADQVIVTDNLPAGLTLVSSDADVGVFDPASGVWAVGSLATGGVQSLTLTTVVDAGTEGQTLTNVATVAPAAGQEDVVPANDRATADVVVALRTADFSLAKTVDHVTASEGDTVVFTLTLTNVGPGEPDEVVVLDRLPAGLTFLSAAPSTGGYDVSTGEWALQLAPGGVATLTVVMTVKTGTTGQTIVNHAQVLSTQGTLDDVPGNDQASASVAVLASGPEVDVGLFKTVDVANPAEADTVVFTINISNAGPDTATSAVVRDTLPTGLIFIDETLPPSVTALGGGQYVVDTLEVDEMVVFTIRAEVAAGTEGSTLTNFVGLISLDQPDSNAANDFSQAAVAVSGPSVDLDLVKTVDVASPAEGDTVVFTIQIVNAGGDTATLAVVRDTLPTGLIFIDETLPPSVTVGGGVGQYVLDTLPAGDTVVFTVRAEVAAGTAGSTLTNFVDLISVDQPDSNGANDFSQAAVTISGPPVDIQVTKAAVPTNPVEGDSVSFVVTVTNIGSVPATNVVVRDSIGPPLTLLTFTGPGAYDSLSGAWAIGTLAAGSSVQLTLVNLIAAGSGGTSLTNTAYLESMTEVDTNPANDTATAVINIQNRTVDIEVTKTADVSTTIEAGQIVFTISVTNQGPGTATGLVVADTLPTGLAFDSAIVSAGALPGDTLWLIPTLAEGQTATAMIFATAQAGSGGTTVTNQALLIGVDQIENPNTNNLGAVSVFVAPDNPPVVTITAPVDGDVFDPGDTISFMGNATDVEDGDLTPIIAWTSDQDGSIGTGAAFTRFTLSPGPHRVVASVTDGQGTTSTDTVDITIAIVTASPTLNVPLGGTASLPISLSAPAPAGGLVITVTSDMPSITAPVSTPINIPGGALSANATLSGLLPGIATVTISSVGFGSATSTVSVTAQLNIIENFLSFANGFGESIRVRLQSQGTPIVAPAGGLSVTLTSRDPTCVNAPATVTIPGGLVEASANFTYGGSATLNCTTQVVATAGSIDPDSVPVTVTPQPNIFANAGTVGAGLQVNYGASLGIANHGGVTVRVESAVPASAQVSPNNSTAGTSFIDIVVPDGSNFVSLYVQGVEGVLDTVPLIFSAPGFVTDTALFAVVQPGVVLGGLGVNTTSLSPDDAFFAYVGIPSGTFLSQFQAVRAGAAPITATFTTSNVGVGQLADTSGTANSVAVQIQPGAANSPTSVVAGGVAFDPVGPGSTTVAVTIPGFVSPANASAAVTVSAPVLTVNNSAVGAGLQRSHGASLGASQHGGVTVRVTSLDPAAMLVSTGAASPGASFVDIVLGNGSTFASFYVQGLEGVIADTVLVAVEAPGFTPDTAQVIVVQPAVILGGLNSTTTSLTADDPFFAYIGIPSGTTSLSQFQGLRFGGPTVTATFVTSAPAVGRLVTSTDTAASVTVDFQPTLANSPTSVASGGVAFDPLTPGGSTVSVSIPGFLTQTNAAQVVTVSGPAITVNNTAVGAGLQRNAGASLSASQHGGVTARITSRNPALMQVSPNAATAGTDFIDVVLNNGNSFASFYVQGVEGAVGTATVVVTIPGFTPDSADISVLQPGIILAGLQPTTTTLSNDDPFFAYIGIPSGTSLSQFQALRAGAAPLDLTFTSSNVGVGIVKTASSSGGSVAVQIQPGFQNSPTSVGGGGVTFDPVGSGPTTVAVSAPGFLAPTAASAAVTVAAPGISVSSATVGAGLQRSLGATLGAPNHGGVTVRITSSNPSVMQVSPNVSTVGADFIDVVVADGQTFVPFYIQGVGGATGVTSVTVVAPGFTDGSGTITVVQPALTLASVATPRTTASANDAFWVTIGYPSGNGVSPQSLRAGSAPITATITSSDVAVGQLVTTATTGASVTVTIQTGVAISPTSVSTGGVEFDPLAVGSTSLSATIPGFIQQPGATVVVIVN